MRNVVKLVVGVLWLLGLWGATEFAVAEGTTRLLGLLLYTSFSGFCFALFFMVYWSREHWL